MEKSRCQSNGAVQKKLLHYPQAESILKILAKINNLHNESLSRSVPRARNKVGGDAQAMVTGDDGYFVNEQAAAFIA